MQQVSTDNTHTKRVLVRTGTREKKRIIIMGIWLGKEKIERKWFEKAV